MLMSDFSFVNVRHMALNLGPSSCVLHYRLWHTKQCRCYLWQFLGGMSNKVGNSCAHDEAVFPSSILLSVLNNYRSRHIFLRAQPSCFFQWCCIKLFKEHCHTGSVFGMCVVCFAHTCCATQCACIGHSHNTWLSLTMASKQAYITASYFIVYHSTPCALTHHTCGKLVRGVVSSSPLCVQISWYPIICFP